MILTSSKNAIDYFLSALKPIIANSGKGMRLNGASSKKILHTFNVHVLMNEANKIFHQDLPPRPSSRGFSLLFHSLVPMLTCTAFVVV